jgi:hypothetical protein
MELQLAITLEKEIHDLGYKSFDDFALKNIKREIQEKIVEYQKLVSVYENKYGMDYKTFCEQFHSLTQWGMFEKEDDSMLWETYLEVIDVYIDKIEHFSNAA